MATVRAVSDSIFTIDEGSVLNLVGSSDAVGIAYRLDGEDGATNPVQSWVLGTGMHSPIGPYAGRTRVLVTCAFGSISAEVGDASLAVPQFVYDDSGNVLGLQGPSNSVIGLGGSNLRVFNVCDYGAKGGSNDDSDAVNAALAAIYANKGGTLVFPFMMAGYTFGSSIVIDPTAYVMGGGINVHLGGNAFTPTHAGWCFDVKTNYFHANCGMILGNKPVLIEGQGAAIYNGGGASALGGVRFTDAVLYALRDLTIRGYSGGTALQLNISSSDKSTWVEHGEVANVRGSGNLTGLHAKSSNTTASFLGNKFHNLAFEGNVNNAKLYNLEGLFFNASFDMCGGYYNQSGTTGGCGFYLNGGYCGTTFLTPWIDAGGAGTQSVATDIVFGPNYEGVTAQYQPILIGVTEIDLPLNWRTNLRVIGPTNVTGALSGLSSGNPREVLVANRTYYVSNSGSDTANTGLSSDSPFATVAHAIGVIYSTVDCAGFNVTIQLADGTYTAPVVVQGMPLGLGTSSLILSGNVSTPGNVILSTTGNHAIRAALGAIVTVQGIKVSTSSSGAGIRAESRSAVSIGSGMQFGACATDHISVTGGSQVSINAGYTINGNAPIHWDVSFASTLLSFGNTISCPGIAFSNVFASCTENSSIGVSGTFSASGATGGHYNINSSGVIQTYGAGASYLPGNADGYVDTATFGVYA
jgi:hypothetical protein